MMVNEGGYPRLSFVVPCYNESANITLTIAAAQAAVKAAGVASHEIVVVDDGSVDGTREVVASLAKSNPAIVLVENPRNLGFGGAYKAGVNRASGTFILMIPGDNAFPSESIARILRLMGEADIIVPYFEQPQARHFARRIISTSYTRLINTMFGLRLPYFNGPVMHTANLLKGIEIKSDGFAFQAESLIKLIKAGAKYKTVAVEVAERTEGRSTALRPKNIVRVLQALPRLWLEVHNSGKDTRELVTQFDQAAAVREPVAPTRNQY